MLDQAKVNQMLAEAEEEAIAEAKAKIKKAMVENLVQKSGVANRIDREDHFDSPLAIFDESKLQEPENKNDWMVLPLPSAEEDFKETSALGIKLRVNRAGTKVERFVDGRWVNVNIVIKEGHNFSPTFFLPNDFCAGSKAKSGVTTFRVSHLVLQAFTEMPKYITDVLFTAKGPSILFGLRLAYHKDFNLRNCALDNLFWVSETVFKTAAKRRAEKLGVSLST